ncbi:MAG: hypothetical protein OHK0018_09170 [Erythrobacter tepidarius]
MTYIEWLWRAEGEVPIDPPLSAAEAFARLDPLFRTPDTTYAVKGDTLTYVKHNPAAQDKLATFTSGTMRVARSEDGAAKLVFSVRSKALLMVFLAPLLFLAFAQVMSAANDWEKAAMEAERAETKAAGKLKDDDKAKPKAELHPLDKMLGAPEPEDPSKKKEENKDKEKFETTPAYVLAGMFFLLFILGRVLEPWLLKRTLRAALASAPSELAYAGSQAELCSGTS